MKSTTSQRVLPNSTWLRASSHSSLHLFYSNQVSYLDHPRYGQGDQTSYPNRIVLSYRIITDRPDLRQVNHVRRLNLFICRSLRAELNKTHHRSPFDPSSMNVYETLISKIPTLREISMLHMTALSRFRRLSPEIEFPALHRELFSMDMVDWEILRD